MLVLAPDVFRKLHTAPADGHYAFGWGVAERTGVRGPLLTHDGSNTLFYATVFAAPALDRVFLVATNRAGPSASRATHEVVDFLFDLVEHSGSRSAPR